MNTSTLRSALLWLLPAVALCTLNATESSQDATATEAQASDEKAVQLHYLEIVTPDVDAMCASLEELHGVTFSKPVPEFGFARTAALAGGGQIGIRAPMRADEDPVVRPYALVDDVESAVDSVRTAGAEIAIPLMEIPERGKFAIYIHGGIQHGLWQN